MTAYHLYEQIPDNRVKVSGDVGFKNCRDRARTDVASNLIQRVLCTAPREDILKGNAISEPVAETAAAAAVKDAVSLSNNKYKVQIARILVKRAILA